MKRSKIFLIIPIVLIIAVVITAIIYYYGYYIKPQQTYIRLVESVLSNKISKRIDSDTYKCTANLKINIPNKKNKEKEDIVEILNNSDINLEAQLNKKNNNLVINLNSDYNNSNLINIKTYTDVQEKSTYVHLADFLNKYLKIDINDKFYNCLDNLMKINKKEINNDIEILKRDLVELVNSNLCDTNKDELLIDNNIIKVSKDTIKLKFNDLISVFKTIYEDIENNSIISKYKNADVEVNVYTSGILKEKIEKVSVTILSEKESLKIDIVDDIYNYEIKNEETTLKGNINIQTNNDEGKIKIVSESNDMGIITIKIDYKLEYNIETEMVNISNNSDINGLTKDEQVILLENFEKSNLYSLIKNMIYK